jgi:hypothetical protein
VTILRNPTGAGSTQSIVALVQGRLSTSQTPKGRVSSTATQVIIPAVAMNRPVSIRAPLFRMLHLRAIIQGC